MKLLLILIFSLLGLYFFETLSFSKILDRKGMHISKLNLLLIVFKILKYDNPKFYFDSKMRLIISLEMYLFTLTEKDRTIFLELDKKNHNSVVSNLIENNIVTIKKGT